MNIEEILIRPNDLPPEHVAGEAQLLTGDHPILHNIGGAETYVIQWIGHIENRAEINAEVSLYQYPSKNLAQDFFKRIAVKGDSFVSIGDECFMSQSSSGWLQGNSIRFRRNCFVVEIRGWTFDAPPYSRNKLTPDVLLQYAKLLDQRLVEIEE